jgi:FixJ family two-component response regulator
MPQMTGVELADAAVRDCPSLPVILATGYGELPAGASRQILKLAKPFSENDLIRTIEMALRVNSGAA